MYYAFSPVILLTVTPPDCMSERIIPCTLNIVKLIVWNKTIGGSN